MNVKRYARALIAGIFAILIILAVSLSAREIGPEQEQGIVRLNSGGYVAFDMRIDSQQSLAVASTLDDSDSNVIHRVLLDEKTRYYLGYDLEIEQLAVPKGISMAEFINAKRFKLTFRPLDPSHIEKLVRDPKYAGIKPHPDFKADFFKTGAVQQLRSLDSIAVTLLVNPTSGALITDVISVNTSPATRLAQQAAVRYLQGFFDRRCGNRSVRRQAVCQRGVPRLHRWIWCQRPINLLFRPWAWTFHFLPGTQGRIRLPEGRPDSAEQNCIHREWRLLRMDLRRADPARRRFL